MYAVTVTLTLRPRQAARFAHLLEENAARSLAEPGCHRFDICTDPARPDEVLLYELYEDEAAFRAHLGTTHFAAFDHATRDMIAEKRVTGYAEVRT